MSEKPYSPADPRLTAFVLGELDETERTAVEQQIKRSPGTRAAVAEIRETIDRVTAALRQEPAPALSAAQRADITTSAALPLAVSQTPDTPRAVPPRRRERIAALIAGGTVVLAALLLLVLPPLGHDPANDGSPMLAANGRGDGYDDDPSVFTADLDAVYSETELDSVEMNDAQPKDGVEVGARVVYDYAQRTTGNAAPTETKLMVAPSIVVSGDGVLPPATEGASSQLWGSIRGQIPQGGQAAGGLTAATTTGTADVPPTPDASGAVGETRQSARQQQIQSLQRYEKTITAATRRLSLTGPASKRHYDGSPFRGKRGANAGPAGGKTGEPLHGAGDTADTFQIDRTKRRIAGAGLFEPGNGDVDEAIAALEPANEQYQPIIENEFLSPLGDPLSTFSIDVDTASYSNVRRFLKQNQWPPAAAVRIEELVNYFRYDYPEPDDGRPFAVNLEVGPCPWQSGHRLVRIGLKGKEIDKSQRPPSNLVFLLDVSGSMRDSNKLPLVKTAMEMLVGEMTEDDRIAIVTYSGSAGLALDSTSGQDKTRIIDAIHALNAGGSTNGEAGIKLAYEQAVGHFINDGANRVILCTDGDFNVGTSDDDELVTLIQDKAKSKVFLSVFGFGMGNLKDGKLEKIADKGNGQYGYVDDVAEARKVFVEELAGTLYTIAKDVKIQVEFNPQQVGAYRLVGYENRMLETPDFNDDTKDAGEIGAGHTVTALYEVVPADKLPAPKPIDDLKYQQHLKPAEDDPLSRELLTLKLRYKQPDADESVKFEYAVTDDQPRTVMPSVDFEWAASVAGFGLLLRNSQYRGQADFDLVRELALGSKGADSSGRRREFLDLVYTAHAMRARQLGQPIPPRDSLPEDKARELAAVGGKYRNLLQRIEVPADVANYGNFTDYGYWAGQSWAGFDNLPKGHWVYVVPHWYIWGEAAKDVAATKPESEPPEQPRE